MLCTTTTFRTEHFQERNEHDLDRIAELAAAPGYVTYDQAGLQGDELLRGRSLRNGSSVSTDLATIMAGICWVHYPWARRLVRVLAEADFVELRTSRNQHKITAEEQRRLQTKKVGIVGLSVGQSVAFTMALERVCGELRLADFDTVELSNLNRLRCGLHELGLPKTTIAARAIAEFDPYLRVECFNEGFNAANASAFLDGLDLVIDECDSLDVKLQLRLAARDRGIPVLMNTSDRGMTDIERFDLEPQRPLFHGRLGDVDIDSLADLSTEQKIPMVMKIIGMDNASVRLRASMLEIGQSIGTWPQLASDVTLGGAVICDVARRLLLGEPVASGRFYCDLGLVGRATPGNAPLPADSASEQPDDASVATASSSLHDTVPRTIAERVMADAALAPSAGNQQPWAWHAGDDHLTVRRRATEGRSILYHDGFAGLVGIGASVESALISARQHGCGVSMRIDPSGDPIAELSLRPGEITAREPLYAQLSRRRSVRSRPDTQEPMRAALQAVLTGAAQQFDGLHISWISEQSRLLEIAAVVEAAERLRVLDPDGHQDMMSELAWCETQHRREGEGIPLSALDIDETEIAIVSMLRDRAIVDALSDWDLGRNLGKLSGELIKTSAGVGLLWSEAANPHIYFHGGRALQRVWLEATRLDIGLCPVTAICYLLSAWRSGASVPPRMADELPSIDAAFRRIFELPQQRADIALFRVVPAAEALLRPRSTWRRPPERACSPDL